MSLHAWHTYEFQIETYSKQLKEISYSPNQSYYLFSQYLIKEYSQTPLSFMPQLLITIKVTKTNKATPMDQQRNESDDQSNHEIRKFIYLNTIVYFITLMKFRVLNLKHKYELCDCDTTSPKG